MPLDLSEEQLRATEAEIGAVFPEDYRRRMMLSNGGDLALEGDDWNLIPIRDTSDRKRLSRTACHVVVETNSFSKWGNWPDRALAIAQNGSGDALVLLRTGDEFGPQVHHWCHEDGALVIVAQCFSDLINDR